MKISKCTCTALLSAFLMFSFTFANARPVPARGGNSGQSLPINTQAWVLLIAGIAIGCWLIIKKNKEVKPQTSNL